MGTRRAERPFLNGLAALALVFASRMECPIHHIVFETTSLAAKWRLCGTESKNPAKSHWETFVGFFDSAALRSE